MNERRQVMIQKLSVISVMILVLLAGVGSVVVATHAFSGGAPSSIGGAPVLLSPLGAANGGMGNGTNVGSVSETTVHRTSTVTVTSTAAPSSTSASGSTSVSTSSTSTAQNSTSSASGSLLVSGSQSGSNSTSHDDGGSDDSGAGGSGSGGHGGDD